jgi:L-malate glycosyltransferase
VTVKTIVHIENAEIVTGSYKALLSMCEGMPEYRHVWVVPTGSAVVPHVKDLYTVYELPFVELGRSPKKIVLYIPMLAINALRLRRILVIEDAAIVHANDLYNLACYAAKLGLRLPVVVHARLLRRSFPRLVYDIWVRIHLRLASRIVAVSEAVKRDWGCHPEVKVIYDVSAPKEACAPYEFAAPEGSQPFRFVYLANYVPLKGQDDALRAIGIAAGKSTRPFTVDFVGEASTAKSKEYLKGLKAFAQEAGLGSVVRFLGATSDVEATLKRYHAALHLSHTESFGMVCFEAGYFGLPVISTACGGPEEIIDDEHSGLLVPVGDASAGARAILSLIEDPSFAAKLSKNARQSIRGKFAADRTSMCSLMQELTSCTLERKGGS